MTQLIAYLPCLALNLWFYRWHSIIHTVENTTPASLNHLTTDENPWIILKETVDINHNGWRGLVSRPKIILKRLLWRYFCISEQWQVNLLFLTCLSKSIPPRVLAIFHTCYVPYHVLKLKFIVDILTSVQRSRYFYARNLWESNYQVIKTSAMPTTTVQISDILQVFHTVTLFSLWLEKSLGKNKSFACSFTLWRPNRWAW